MAGQSELTHYSTRSRYSVVQAPKRHHRPPPKWCQCRRGSHYRSLFQEPYLPPQFDDQLLALLPTLPYEIIEEILSRLPVKSLCRFRCVCKSFKSLVSDPYFVKTHLKNTKSSLETNPDLHGRLVFTYAGPTGFRKSCCSINSIFNRSNTTNTSELDHLSLEFRLVGSCDGLICIQAQESIVVLWNPSTRTYNRMFDLDFETKLSSDNYTVFGFGYDSTFDDYKVVAVFCTLNNDGEYDTRVKVCTRRTRCWRTIEGGFAYGFPAFEQPGRYINGNVVWPAKCGTVWSYVSFDLAKETYMQILQPYCGELLKEYGILNGCFCVMCTCRSAQAEIWVMKEFGVNESWKKMMRIPYFWVTGDYVFPHYISKNGEILLELLEDCRLVIYNPRDGRFRYPAINGIDTMYESEIYFESLVSP